MIFGSQKGDGQKGRSPDRRKARNEEKKARGEREDAHDRDPEKESGRGTGERSHPHVVQHTPCVPRCRRMIRENVVAREIVAASYRVHETLGPGLLESVYEAALAYELASANLPLRRQHPIPVRYNDVLLATGFRADLLVDGCVLVEIKSVREFAPVHFRQLDTYLRLADLRLGLLLNFGEWRMRRGIKRVLNGLYETAEQTTPPAA